MLGNIAQPECDCEPGNGYNSAIGCNNYLCQYASYTGGRTRRWCNLPMAAGRCAYNRRGGRNICAIGERHLFRKSDQRIRMYRDIYYGYCNAGCVSGGIGNSDRFHYVLCWRVCDIVDTGGARLYVPMEAGRPADSGRNQCDLCCNTDR